MSWRQWQIFLKDNAKPHECRHKVNVHKCSILRLDDSYRLVTKVLVQNSHSRKIQNIFLTTIAGAATCFMTHRGKFPTAMDISGTYDITSLNGS
jgi:hypothetical protein